MSTHRATPAPGRDVNQARAGGPGAPLSEHPPAPPPDLIPAKDWNSLPADLQVRWLLIARELLPGFMAGHGAEEGRARAYRLAFARVKRQEAWRRRGADARTCPKGCGVPVLWRWEIDLSGNRRRVPSLPSGTEHGCEATR